MWRAVTIGRPRQGIETFGENTLRQKVENLFTKIDNKRRGALVSHYTIHSNVGVPPCKISWVVEERDDLQESNVQIEEQNRKTIQTHPVPATFHDFLELATSLNNQSWRRTQRRHARQKSQALQVRQDIAAELVCLLSFLGFLGTFSSSLSSSAPYPLC